METLSAKRPRLEGGESGEDPRRKFANSEELREYVRNNKEAINSNRLVITNWDVSDVTDMRGLFEGLESFNQQLDWATSNVTTMSLMFRGCRSFNQLLKWDTSKVEYMGATFEGCSSFNQLLEWDTRNVTTVRAAFRGCSSLNQQLGWDTSKVTDMSTTFEGCSSLNKPLSWKTGNVTDMSAMFKGCSSFNKPLKWDTCNVTDMSSTFEGCSSFNRPLEWDTRKVTDMRYTFKGCSSFNQQLKWGTHKVKNMNLMFYGCKALNSVMEFDMTNVSDISLMFENAGPGAGVRDMGMVAGLERLKDGDKPCKDNDPSVCNTCYARIGRYLIHPPDPAKSTPHIACGECIEKFVLESFERGKPLKCLAGCGRDLELSELQKTAFGRYARRASGHKQRAEVYRTLHRVLIADAHDARAREYAIGAARVLHAAASFLM